MVLWVGLQHYMYSVVSRMRVTLRRCNGAMGVCRRRCMAVGRQLASGSRQSQMVMFERRSADRSGLACASLVPLTVLITLTLAHALQL